MLLGNFMWDLEILNFKKSARKYSVHIISNINTSGLYLNAWYILSLNRLINIRVIPHPGQYKPVILWITQGIPLLVKIYNIP